MIDVPTAGLLVQYTQSSSAPNAFIASLTVPAHPGAGRSA
jgi:hypothetical protein